MNVENVKNWFFLVNIIDTIKNMRGTSILHINCITILWMKEFQQHVLCFKKKKKKRPETKLFCHWGKQTAQQEINFVARSMAVTSENDWPVRGEYVNHVLSATHSQRYSVMRGQRLTTALYLYVWMQPYAKGLAYQKVHFHPPLSEHFSFCPFKT